jgi:hypothetical protein
VALKKSEPGAAYPWTPGAVRIIMPVFDEAPRCGGNVIDQDDINSMDNAAKHVCKIIVAPIYEENNITGLRDLAQELAGRGAFGGKVFDSSDSEPVLLDKLLDLFRAACPKDCNGNGMIDSCDLVAERSFDCFARTNCCMAHSTPGCEDETVSAATGSEDVGVPF